MWDVQIATVDEDLKMTVEKWPVVQAFGYDEWLDESTKHRSIYVCLRLDGRVLKGLQLKPYNDCASTPIEIRTTGLGQVGSSGIRGEWNSQQHKQRVTTKNDHDKSKQHKYTDHVCK